MSNKNTNGSNMFNQFKAQFQNNSQKNHKKSVSEKNNNSKKRVKIPKQRSKHRVTVSKKSIEEPINNQRMEFNNGEETQLLWNMQADVRAIGKLTALKNLYGLKNRTQVLDLMFNKCLHDLINYKGNGAQRRFNVYYEGFVMKNKPKAIKRYDKYHK